MALETGTYISDLVATNPVSGDTVNQADDHLRLLKSTIKNTFPNINGAVSLTDDQLNLLDSKTLSAVGHQKLPSGIIIQWGRDVVVTAGTASTVTLPIAWPNAGFQVIATHDNPSAVNEDLCVCAAELSGTTSLVINAARINQNTGSIGVRWLAIGY